MHGKNPENKLTNYTSYAYVSRKIITLDSLTTIYHLPVYDCIR